MRRRPADPERTRSVLVFCAGVAVLFALALTGWAAISGTWQPLPVAVVMLALAVGCHRLAQDDGRGSWCEVCVARNPEDASTCGRCGALLG